MGLRQLIFRLFLSSLAAVVGTMFFCAFGFAFFLTAALIDDAAETSLRGVVSWVLLVSGCGFFCYVFYACYSSYLPPQQRRPPP